MNACTFTLIPLFLLGGFAMKVWSQDVTLATGSSGVQFIRVLETDDFFDAINLDGIAFPPYSNTVLRVKGKKPGKASLEVVAKGNKPGSADNTMVMAIDPLALSYDTDSDDLYVLDEATSNLRLLKTRKNDRDGNSASAGFEAVKQASFSNYGLRDARGIATDPATGIVYVLDRKGKRLVTIKPSKKRGENRVTSLEGGQTVKLKLTLNPQDNLKGLAFNNADGRVYSVNVRTRELVSFDAAGSLVPVGRFANDEWDEPVAIVFASSLDLTDNPNRIHLFVASESGRAGQVTEWFVQLAAGE